jgi:general secretion pathway protein D
MRLRGLLACLPLAALTLFAHAAPARAEGGTIPINQCNARPLVQRTYAVADLVVPIDMDNEPGKRPDTTTREAELMSLILSAVAPDSWESVGGVGTLQYFPLGMALVARQTAPVHEEIAQLLTALRRLQDVEIAVQVRVMQVSDEVLQRLRREQCADRCCARSARPLAVLDDRELNDFLKSAQGDRSVSMTQLPKLTVFNGQRAPISVTDEVPFITDLKVSHEEGQVVLRPKTETMKTGVTCAVRPVASADRRSVKMWLDFTRNIL